jgi:hypothetical protein
MEYGFDVKMGTYNELRLRLSLNQTVPDHSIHHPPYLNSEDIRSVRPANRRGTRGQWRVQYEYKYHTLA